MKNLSLSSYQVCAFDVSEEAMKSVENLEKVSLAESPNALASDCDVVMTMVPNDKVLKSVCDESFLQVFFF